MGNNALLSYANQHQIYQALLNQELIVSHEIFMTPTAMLADYVLPGDVFTERESCCRRVELGHPTGPVAKGSRRPEEASSTFQFWTDLAHRMGFGDEFPWGSLEDMLDYRLSRGGRTFAEFESATYMELPPPKYQKYRQTGFATPSGKVELASSVLADLGFDPLPYYRELPVQPDEFPYLVFTGVREDPFFQTGQRNIESLRRRTPTPNVCLHPADAQRGFCRRRLGEAFHAPRCGARSSRRARHNEGGSHPRASRMVVPRIAW